MESYVSVPTVSLQRLGYGYIESDLHCPKKLQQNSPEIHLDLLPIHVHLLLKHVEA